VKTAPLIPSIDDNKTNGESQKDRRNDGRPGKGDLPMQQQPQTLEIKKHQVSG
jgi:hypothetical protein